MHASFAKTSLTAALLSLLMIAGPSAAQEAAEQEGAPVQQVAPPEDAGQEQQGEEGPVAEGVSPPEGMPPDIAQLFQDVRQTGGDVAIAPSEAPEDMETGGAAATAGSNYLYTTLRVVTSGSPRGCGYADWNCMTNLCRSDLGDASSWRGWAGCWRRDSWICYFECGQRRAAF